MPPVVKDHLLLDDLACAKTGQKAVPLSQGLWIEIVDLYAAAQLTRAAFHQPGIESVTEGAKVSMRPIAQRQDGKGQLTKFHPLLHQGVLEAHGLIGRIAFTGS